MDDMILKLEQWRKLRGFSQEELAEKAGVSTRSIWNYENNPGSLLSASYENVRKIALVLGVKTNQIFLNDISEKPKI